MLPLKENNKAALYVDNLQAIWLSGKSKVQNCVCKTLPFVWEKYRLYEMHLSEACVCVCVYM